MSLKFLQHLVQGTASHIMRVTISASSESRRIRSQWWTFIVSSLKKWKHQTMETSVAICCSLSSSTVKFHGRMVLVLQKVNWLNVILPGASLQANSVMLECSQLWQLPLRLLNVITYESQACQAIEYDRRYADYCTVRAPLELRSGFSIIDWRNGKDEIQCWIERNLSMTT